MKNSQEFFNQTLPQKLANDAMCLAGRGLEGRTIALDLNGDMGGQWTLAVSTAGLATISQGLAQKPDVTVRASDKVFQGLIDGSVNVAMAVMLRKIKIDGDIKLAGQAGQALKSIL